MSVHNTHDAEHETDALDEDRLDPDEPHTPGWLTLLGCALFLAVGILLVATDEPADASLSTTTSAVTEVAEPPAQPVAAPPQPTGAAVAKDQEATRAAAQKLIEQLKRRQAPGGAGIQLPQPPAP